MIMNVNFLMFCDAFVKMDRKDNFSYEGKKALFDYLEEIEEETGERIELDVISLCCEYTEYTTATEASQDFGFETENEQGADEFLENNTIILRFKTGIIIQNF